MISFNGIKSFSFRVAEYHLIGEEGDDAILHVDYEHNTFDLEIRASKEGKAFLEEASRIANDLLKRKHGLNVAAAPHRPPQA